MSEPWSNDDQFEVVELKNVRQDGDGWVAERVDGWSFFIPAGDVKPAVGSIARLYGKGIGYPIRGLFIDGVKSFYRTEAEDEAHRECERYGADAADLLARWDAGKSVFTVERGGLGPGYEQAIQVAMFEVLRHLVAAAPDASGWVSDTAAYRAAIDEMERVVLPIVEPLGLSGAQWGTAYSLAARIYRSGPRDAIKSAPDDQRIQVSHNFPSLAQADVLTPYDHIRRADALLHAAYDTPCEPGDEAWHKQQAHGLIHDVAAHLSPDPLIREVAVKEAAERGRALILKGLERASEVVCGAAWRHGGDDAYSQGMDAGARGQVDACVKAIDAEIALLRAERPPIPNERGSTQEIAL